ncbi:hypothetical protein BDY24DRAFT_413248 [Mrakia frigida]|uniref:uncharacterized protein n=1 Tax=Mrakia frigida TaxID=29902 RepID=UPI003FCBF834
MSYPALNPPQSRSSLLAGLRGQNLPPPSNSNGRALSGTNNNSNLGYAPRLPPHTPQHRQRFPSSEHTLGPSFDDDDEDEEMVAKMAALNAGQYPYQGQQQGGGGNGGHHGGNGGGMMPRGQQMGGGGGMQRGGNGGGGMEMGMGMGGGDRGGGGGRGNQQQHQQQSLAYQQQMQQQELLRVLTLQTLASNQGPRNLEELQLLQALAQQQQQREMEAQVEQLLRIQVHQQAQQLQQQLIAQAQQAAMLAAQPNGNHLQHPNQQQRAHALPPPSASFNQRSFDQSYAQAQAQVQMANQAQRVQQTPQQLASAYEQRHAAQQQIQANLRARSGVPPLPTPAAVAASGHRFGFEVEQPRDDVHGAGIFGNGGGLGRQTLSRGLSPQPGAGAVGERTGVSPGPGAGSQGGGGDRSRVGSPLDGGLNTPQFGGLNIPSSQGGARDLALYEYDQREVPSLAGAASVWTAGKSDASGNWRTKPADSPPPNHPRSASTGVVSPPPVSRFTGTFSPPPHSRDSSTPIGSRFQSNNGVGLEQDAHSDSSSHPSGPNSNSDENEGSRSPTSSEGNTLLNSNGGGRGSWNTSGGDILKPIYEGLGLGRPYPVPQQPEKTISPTGFGGNNNLRSMSAAAAALNAQNGAEIEQIQRPSPVEVHPRTRSYDLGGGVGNGGAAYGSGVIRQPRGPPSPADELGARNFASRLRKKAGSNLSVLGRREQTASPSA